MGFSGIITRADVSFYLFARGISIRCCSSIFQLETWTDERSDGRRTINDCSCVRQYAPILLDRPATMAFQNAHLTSTRMEFHSHLCSWIPFELSPRNWLISTHPLLSTLRARSYFTLSNYISPRPRCSPQIFPFPRSPLLLSSAQSRAFISSTSTLILHFFPSFFLFFSFLGGERRDREICWRVKCEDSSVGGRSRMRDDAFNVHRFNCDETSRRRLSVQICSANSAPFNIQTVQSWNLISPCCNEKAYDMNRILSPPPWTLFFNIFKSSSFSC